MGVGSFALGGNSGSLDPKVSAGGGWERLRRHVRLKQMAVATAPQARWLPCLHATSRVDTCGPRGVCVPSRGAGGIGGLQ